MSDTIEPEPLSAPTDRATRRAQAFAETLERIEATIDWPRLERVYCDVEPDIPAGELVGFFGAEAREAQAEAALRFAADLGQRLSQGGASLYVGAGVAEIAPIVAETVLLGRSVRFVTLPGAEAEELARAFAAASVGLPRALPRIETRPLESLALGPVDHVWFASVLTDPEAFPALHRALYETGPTTGRAVSAESRRARALLGAVFASLAPRGWVTTSDEELPLVKAALLERGVDIHVPEVGRLSAIVGDVLRHVSLSPHLPGDPGQGMLGRRRHSASRPRPPRPQP